MQTQQKKVTAIVCNCTNTRFISKTTVAKIKESLTGQGISFVNVNDLCGSLVQNKDSITSLLNGEALTIFACYPRTVSWLFHSVGYKLPPQTQIINIREKEFNELKIDSNHNDAFEHGLPIKIDTEGDWIPWFPVIDYARCKNCKQCLSFCIFGVYQVNNTGNVSVQNPQNCKNNCPACARICPEAAIIFPKINESPINGAEIIDETQLRANIKLNVEKMLGDDIYAALAERRKKAKLRLLRKKEIEKGHNERKKCSTANNRKDI